MIVNFIAKTYKFSCLLIGWAFVFCASFFLSIRVGKKVRFFGAPILNLDVNSNLIIGDNVTINSKNYFYHFNMYARTKFFIEGFGSYVSIGSNTRLHGVCIHARKKIAIGERCLIAANTNIIDSNGHKVMMDKVELRYLSVDVPKDVVIEDDVWIGANCFILPGAHIGKGSVVSANSVVKGYVPPYSIVCGNPAKVIGKNDAK